MKNSLSQVIPIAGFILAMPLAGQPVAAADAGTQQKEIRQSTIRVVNGEEAEGGAPRIKRHVTFVGHPDGPQEMEVVTFLGVMTKPLDDTLAAQMGLQPDMGLIVATVMEGSPAATLLKVHDILTKLDDQMLIDQHQLSVLVRSHKEGDEVALTYIRAGKTETAKVKLGKTERPKQAFFNEPIPLPSGKNMSWVTSSVAAAPRADVDRILNLMDLGADGAPRVVLHNVDEGQRSITVTVATGDSNLNYSDDKGALELKVKDGKKELVAKDMKGATLFSGPINTDEERKGIPPEIAERLKKIERMEGVSFKTGEGFQGGEVKVVRPLGRGVALPLPAPAPTAAPSGLRSL